MNGRNRLAETLAIHGTLKYVGSEDHIAWYLSETTGYDIPLGSGGRILVDLEDLDVNEVWEEWLAGHSRYDLAGFEAYVTSLLVDPDEWEDWTHCKDCQSPEHRDDTYSVYDGSVCESCIDEYASCYSCEERYGRWNNLRGEAWCYGCTSEHWTYCDDCGEYYRDEESHSHDGSGCCESPQMQFAVRNNGHGLLGNDERTEVSLPAGEITDEGMGAIANCLRNWSAINVWDRGVSSDRNPTWVEHLKWHDLSLRLGELGNSWQAKQGNFTKRLSRFAYNEHQISLPPEVVSEVGNIARAHSSGKDLTVTVTRDLNQGREYFAHDGSCWWSEYSESRCALKTNGGYGLRSWSDEHYPDGRAWVMPLKQVNGNLTPTFETEEPAAFVVFNGYGDLDGYTAARIVAHMAGMTYRKIEFTCDPMYVNNEAGYLVAPEEIAGDYTDGDLNLSVHQHSPLYEQELEEKRASSVTETTCTHFEPCSHTEMEIAHV